MNATEMTKPEAKNPRTLHEIVKKLRKRLWNKDLATAIRTTSTTVDIMTTTTTMRATSVTPVGQKGIKQCHPLYRERIWFHLGQKKKRNIKNVTVARLYIM